MIPQITKWLKLNYMPSDRSKFLSTDELWDDYQKSQKSSSISKKSFVDCITEILKTRAIYGNIYGKINYYAIENIIIVE